MLGEVIETALQRVVDEFSREPDPEFGMGGMHAIGESIYDESAPVFSYDSRQGACRERLQNELLEDLRFEHLSEKAAEELTWQFIVSVDSGAELSESTAVIMRELREPREDTIWFWLERFTTPVRFEFSGVEFVPASEYPRESIKQPADENPATLIQVVEVGTNSELMRFRARAQADIALGRLRMVLDEDREIYPDQLQFYIGYRYAFPDGIPAKKRLRRTPLHLAIGEVQAEDVNSRQIGELPLSPESEVEEQIQIATNWIDRALHADDDEIAILFLFFALEALFTKKENNPKGLGKHVTVRRATLGLLVVNRYSAPFYKPRLYNKVRSKAVHGEEPWTFSEDMRTTMAADTRRSLMEYINYVKENDFTKRWEVIGALDKSAKREHVVNMLKQNEPQAWSKFE